VRDQRHAPAAFYPRKRPGTHFTGGWVGPRAGLDKCGKSRPPTGFDPRTVQPVASRYNDWATRPTACVCDAMDVIWPSTGYRSAATFWRTAAYFSATPKILEPFPRILHIASTVTGRHVVKEFLWQPWRWRQQIPLKRLYRFVYNNVNGVIHKKTKLFIKNSKRTFKP
jgi:hypothetical protein